MENINTEAKQYLRFTRLNRTLHAVMIVSFISLAMTGMTLKFSYTTWAHTLSRIFGGFEFAGYIHRFAAVVMFGIFFTHLFELLYRKRKKYGSVPSMVFGPNTMLPTKKDFKDFLGSLKWFLGLGDRPKYGRWLNRIDALVPGILYNVFTGLANKCSHYHPQR
jgi:hypothetical protein